MNHQSILNLFLGGVVAVMSLVVSLLCVQVDRLEERIKTLESKR